MSIARIRKIAVFVDEIHIEQGRPIDPPTRRACAVAVIENPFAGKFVEDLSDLMQIGEELADCWARGRSKPLASLLQRPKATARQRLSGRTANWNMPQRFCIRSSVRHCARRCKKAQPWCRRPKSAVVWARFSMCRLATRMPLTCVRTLTAWKCVFPMHRVPMKFWWPWRLPIPAGHCRGSAGWPRMKQRVKTVCADPWGGQL